MTSTVSSTFEHLVRKMVAYSRSRDTMDDTADFHLHDERKNIVVDDSKGGLPCEDRLGERQ